MDTDTRTGATSSYKEKFSSKEAIEIATLQFNPFPCVYIAQARSQKFVWGGSFGRNVDLIHHPTAAKEHSA